jgi:hypothetical protein
MKLIIAHYLLLGCLALAISMDTARAETPTEAVDRVWNTFVNLDSKRQDNFPSEFVKLSKKIANEQGTAVIAPIMLRSKDWKGEECLIFATLVDFLPRDQAIQVLQRYKKDGKLYEKQAAEDFLAEFDMMDVKEMVKKYSSEK